METKQITSAAGFTLIEMLIVISIAVMLSAIAAPSAVQAMRTGAMNGTVSDVLETCHEARSLAVRSNPPPVTGEYACFGVILVDPSAGRSFVAVTYGTNDTPTEADILLKKRELWSTWEEYQAATNEVDAHGDPIPVHRAYLAETFGVYTADPTDIQNTTSKVSSMGWLFQHQTGAVIGEASPTADWIHIGEDPLILVQDPEGRLGANFEIFPTGLIHSADLEDLR